jgi:hypothetical protein
MSTKLTAKLSDGRELDVCSEWHAKEDDYTMIVAKPATKKPSPPKEVWIAYNSSGVKTTYFYRPNVEAYEKANVPVHRYVLAEEPKAEEDSRGFSVKSCIKCGVSFNYVSSFTRRRPEICSLCWEGDQEKPQPREWWDVRVRASGDVCATRKSKERAEDYLRPFSQAECQDYEIVHVREVLPHGQDKADS